MSQGAVPGRGAVGTVGSGAGGACPYAHPGGRRQDLVASSQHPELERDGLRRAVRARTVRDWAGGSGQAMDAKPLGGSHITLR